ncbi:PREDICTED: dolichyl-diphosphooligosaccharide--protein glycosyltransferase subunit 2 [Polistes dominula]|uniref:Dolichyl-diphosphooligosaccharide--protein glycosyltransferase subunit 2 n=1 Tax=Polistes dominula TaxID=743375 RepID=A0ABM1IFH1_POLDO|nr:PREDICTED: dolichyl-diphosphooligosaccharide--protein glycosyltransferase subunit 2 [Polistes dominula]XP_015178958.1 PREDICTED: dolichyl-diphosphooligosaccharide--protein glycosyltransferase subunit 2 [Polistes dominula]
MAAILLLLVVSVLSATYTVGETIPSVISYLSENDKIRLKHVIDPGFNLQDPTSTYYSVYGYQLLHEPILNKEKICNYLLKSIGDGNNVVPETAFYIVSAWKAIDTCQDLPIPAITKVLMNTIDKDTSTFAELYYAVNTLTLLSQKITTEKSEKLAKTLAFRKDDSLWNLGYTFHIASDLGSFGTFALHRIEDAIIQADEVNGQFLQFEGGLSITSFLVNGIFKLSNSLKKKPLLTSQQIVKLTNYLLSRRSVQTPKGVVSLLSALNTLATYEHETLVCITLPEEGVIVSNKQPLVTVKVCDIFGKPLASVPKVITNYVNKLDDDTAILNKETLQSSTTDKTLFTMDLMKAKPERGFYKISVSAASATNIVMVKVLSEVVVDYLEIGTGDADQTTQPKLTRVTYLEKLNQKIEADSQQKLVVRFLLKDSANKKPMRVHQAFIRLSSTSTTNNNNDNEITFVAEPDNANIYKFDMPLAGTAINFAYRSGDYKIALVIGDAVLSNSFEWTIATVNLKFPDAVAAESSDKNAIFKQKADIYTTKPEIKHMFREPEKRPPAFVSNLFTGLCLAPALLLIILWAKLGVNISNFPLSLSAVTFHLGLGGIFVLFGVFWLKLNMFVTLRYLLGLGVVTFLAGNKLLSNIAHKHKS